MPFPPTFVIGEFDIKPTPPENWSFSSLKCFEECPMQWVLSRTPVKCFCGTIPQKVNRASLEGTLLHDLIGQYDSFKRKPDNETFRPRRKLLELVSMWAKSNMRNPRIDTRAISGQVRVEEVLRAFYEATRHVRWPERQATGGASSLPSGRKVWNGSEAWLRDPESKLWGRADFISAGEIIDFKSGEPHHQHVEQLSFYAALYLAIVGRPPTTLRLIYTTTDEVREIPMPTLGELERLLEQMRQRATDADQMVAARKFSAWPQQTRCSFCVVRGFCGDYWQSLSGAIQQGQPTNIVDYAPTRSAAVEPAALGIYIRDNWAGGTSLLHVPQEVAEEIGTSFKQTRWLALRISSGTAGVRFSFTQNSEVYVS